MTLLFFVIVFILLDNSASEQQEKDARYKVRKKLVFAKDTKTKRRLYLCLIEFVDWRYRQSLLVFSAQLCVLLPLFFSLVSS